MIIKSLGRKAGQGGGSIPRVFGKLIRYMNRGIEEEDGKAVIWHHIEGSASLSESELQAEFERNARFLRSHQKGNVLYHEILSFSSEYLSHGGTRQSLENRITQIGEEYLSLRAKDQMAYGVIHRDTDHLHLHLLISANAVEQSKRQWLTKAEFAVVQKKLEAYVMRAHPELGQTLIYGRDRQAERLKTQTHEQAMTSRSGKSSRKEDLKSQLHQIFEMAGSQHELDNLLQKLRTRLYTRGKSVGVIVLGDDGSERRHRFSSLGLDEHYQATHRRFAQEQTKSREGIQPTMQTKAQDMAINSKAGGVVWGQPEPIAAEIVMETLVTGKLHPQWHGDSRQVGDTTTAIELNSVYSDDILKKLKEREKAKGEGDRGRGGTTGGRKPPAERDDDR
jgi:Relaxase/Mobilisation nuclease domain